MVNFLLERWTYSGSENQIILYCSPTTHVRYQISLGPSWIIHTIGYMCTSLSTTMASVKVWRKICSIFVKEYFWQRLKLDTKSPMTLAVRKIWRNNSVLKSDYTETKNLEFPLKHVYNYCCYFYVTCSPLFRNFTKDSKEDTDDIEHLSSVYKW
jgi:hypothetical protein